jgi:hypothetical protein
MYGEIYNFCKVKNKGMCFSNGAEPTPRVNFITDLCKKQGIEFELDVWGEKGGDKIGYSILDFPDIKRYLSSDQIKKGTIIFREFNNKAKKIDPYGGVDFFSDYYTTDDLDMLGPEFEDLFYEYTKRIIAEIGEIKKPANNFFNVILKGSSNKWVVAHHDIVNPASDNANDNSCSVINAIAIKKERPEVNVVLLDGEEVGGIGSQRLSEKIKSEGLPCKWILNLELTGKGGKNFFVGAMGTPLTDWILRNFECPLVKVPFNDSVIFKKNGINSTVINPLPIIQKETSIYTKDGNFLNESLLFLCHRMEDSVDKISTSDMKEFVEEVCLKIIDEA